MTTFVKICGMTDEAAVRAAVDAGADALGFVFHERSPRNITVEAAARLMQLVPTEITRVAVSMHPDASLWREVQAGAQFDALQTDAADFNYLDVEAGIEKWPVLREGALPGELPAMYVYEGAKSGHGQTVDWDVAAQHAKNGKMILAGGLSVDNVATAIRQVSPYGVDVSSAVESAPGKKDTGLIRAFIEAAKAA